MYYLSHIVLEHKNRLKSLRFCIRTKKYRSSFTFIFCAIHFGISSRGFDIHKDLIVFLFVSRYGTCQLEKKMSIIEILSILRPGS